MACFPDRLEFGVGQYASARDGAVCGQPEGRVLIDVPTFDRPVAENLESHEEMIVLTGRGKALQSPLEFGVGEIDELSLEGEAVEEPFVISNGARSTRFLLLLQK